MMTDFHTAYFGLGTNLGDRQANLLEARRRLVSQVTIDGASSIYETDPWGFEEQPPFLNQVLVGRTALAPEDLLTLAKSIERQMGRQPTFRYGPRLIDIDILMVDQLRVNTERLTLPHPRLAERAFVIIPLAELAPDVNIPGADATAGELAQRMEETGGLTRWNPEDDDA
jgi:2-amino-4-hydroxy-6-hydroxymethyldihydropteridine diphosphokinase